MKILLNLIQLGLIELYSQNKPWLVSYHYYRSWVLHELQMSQVWIVLAFQW